MCMSTFLFIDLFMNLYVLLPFLTQLFYSVTLLRPLTMMSILNAYKPLIPIPTISRLFSISHARSSTTKTSAGYRERSEENFNLRFKKYTDLEYRKLVCKRNKVTTERYQRRPEIRARNREYATVARIVKGPSLGPRGAPWSIWLREHAWVRDELDWMSHKPVWSDVKVERNCELCNYPPANGAKLWWVRTRRSIPIQQNGLIAASALQDWLVALQTAIQTCGSTSLRSF